MLHPVLCNPVPNGMFDVVNPVAFWAGGGVPEWMTLGWNLFQPDPIVGPEPVFSVASPNYDESGNNIGLNPRVDAGKGLWMGPQVANLYIGASSLCRSLTPSINADNSITYTVNLIETNCFARNNSASSSQRSVKLIVSGNVPYIYVRTASDVWASVNLSNASVVNTDPVTYITARLLGGGKVEITLTTTLSTLSSVYAMNQFGPSRVSGGILEQSNASGVQIGDYITIHSGVITSTPYPMPYVPPGATQLTNAATTGGNGTNIPLDAGLLKCFGNGVVPAVCTMMVEDYMGVGSAELPNDTTVSCISVSGSTYDLRAYKNTVGGMRFVGTYDGTSYLIAGTDVQWSANEIHRRYIQTSSDGTKFRVGYQRFSSAMVEITAGIQWSHTGAESTWAAFDGSFNPLTYLRMCLNVTVPIWGRKLVVANKSLSAAEISDALGLVA